MNWPHKSQEGTQRIVKGQEKLLWCFCQILLLRPLEVPFITLPTVLSHGFYFPFLLIFPKVEEQNTQSQSKRNLQLQFSYFLKGCPAVHSWSVLYFRGLYSLQVQGEKKSRKYSWKGGETCPSSSSLYTSGVLFLVPWILDGGAGGGRGGKGMSIFLLDPNWIFFLTGF